MRIHTDTLTDSDLHAAAKAAGPKVRVSFTRHGSRRRDHAYEFSLTGTSNRWTNTGQRGAGADRAATWDEWGMFLAELFRRDESAAVPRVYESAAHFHWTTADRFKHLTPPYQHGGAGHRWVYAGAAGAADNSYSISVCDFCEAEVRRGGWTK